MQKHPTKKVIDILWIDDPKLFNQISNDVTNRYNRYKKNLKKIKNHLNYYLFKTF